MDFIATWLNSIFFDLLEWYRDLSQGLCTDYQVSDTAIETPQLLREADTLIYDKSYMYMEWMNNHCHASHIVLTYCQTRNYCDMKLSLIAKI